MSEKVPGILVRLKLTKLIDPFGKIGPLTITLASTLPPPEHPVLGSEKVIEFSDIPVPLILP